MYYKKIAKKYKALCRKSRVSSWKKYKETRQTVNDIVKLMNIIQKKKQTNINTFTKDNGGTTDPGDCLLYTSPSPRDKRQSRMPSSA